MEGGIDDVGLGVLFGLELYRYEFAGLLMHAEHLEAVHGVGPHTISVPRLKRADDIDPNAFDNGISDDIFAKLCAYPYFRTVYGDDHLDKRKSGGQREGACAWRITAKRRVKNERGRLCRAGAGG